MEQNIGGGPSGGKAMPEFTGQMGADQGWAVLGMATPGEAATGALVQHFAREVSATTFSLWPQFLRVSRKYFNVNHGYVLHKIAWQIVPLPQVRPGASSTGELGCSDHRYGVRISEGLEMAHEEPDMYIPLMGFVTYVLLCGLARGLVGEFHPDVLSSITSFAAVMMTLEVLAAKGMMYIAGAMTAPALDILALLGYKYMYLSLVLFVGFVLGPGIVYNLFFLVQCGCSAFAFVKAIEKIPRMQPTEGHVAVQLETNFGPISNLHVIVVRAIAVAQIFVCWILAPSWPKTVAKIAAAKVAPAAVKMTVAPAVAAGTHAAVEAALTTTLKAVSGA